MNLTIIYLIIFLPEEKNSFNNSDGKNQDELGIKINTLDYLEEEPEKIKKLNKIIADLKSVTKVHHNEKPYQLKVPDLNITEIRLLLNNFSSNCSQSQFIGMYFRNFLIKL